MKVASEPLRLLTVEVRSEHDVVIARQRARQLAHSLGLEGQVQTRIATAVSEIARNAFQHAGGGRVEFSVLTEAHPAKPNRYRQTFVIEVRDKGPGIARLDDILTGGYRSKSGLGIGIIGSQRLMDRVDIASSEHGTAITLTKILPLSAGTRSAKEIQAIVDDLSKRPSAGTLEEFQIQNQELLHAMEELGRVNEELAETNRGVLALYDELETVNRISLMLASKLELRPLIQSIIDVTTTLTDAEVGVFFFHEKEGGWQLYASSGVRADALTDFPANSADDFFGPDVASGESVRISDLELHKESCSCSQFVTTVADKLNVRSCLTLPVLQAGRRLIGAFIFAHSKPQIFTERSERILMSVATQAAVSIEKAMLYQTVTAASDAKDQFFAMLSHELRTPLQPALAIISCLRADARVPADLQEDISAIARNILLEARLIDDLLDFNRLIKGKLELTMDGVDMHALIRNVVEICREDLNAKVHQLAVELHSPKSRVIGDAARLQQVLWNVLKNAIKFTPANGSIFIRTWLVDQKLRIEIIDNGCGIEPTLTERIFASFDQGKKHIAAHFGGLGLGLTIAKMFVNLHHGSISASSRGLGKGTTIAIEIPIFDAPRL
jgi:signal transduction histidine kinase